MPLYVNEHEAEGTMRVTGASESDLARKGGGDTIELGGIRVRLLHTPGHTPGSQCFLVEEPGQPGRLVSGDTLFLGSCGRVDLPGADPAAMYRSLNETLERLPDETLLYPGHHYSAEPRHARPREAHEPVPARREPRSVPDVHGGLIRVSASGGRRLVVEFRLEPARAPGEVGLSEANSAQQGANHSPRPFDVDLA